MPKLSVRDLDVRGKRVLVRVDFNVPTENRGGKVRITDDTRIRESLPTVNYLRKQGAKTILMSHFGRPNGKSVPKYSLRPIGEHLHSLIHQPVIFSHDTIGEVPEKIIQHMENGDVALLENVRFQQEEEANDPKFAEALAKLGDLYVNDAFGAAHRAHASVEAIVHLVPHAGAGLLMEKELRYLGEALSNPERPFMAVLGGAKVSDKIEVIENLITCVDRLLIGGAMAYTFFKAQDIPVGQSLVEDDKLDAARDILARAQQRGLQLLLPVDHVVAAKPEAGVPTETLKVGDASIGERMGLDIGPATVAAYTQTLKDAKTVVWNGPMGVFEIDAFAQGTVGVARAIADVTGTTIVGGGDSIAAVTKAGVADRITHISTGGGASLEFLGGLVLPGVAALPDK